MVDVTVSSDKTLKQKRIWTISTVLVPCLLSAIALYSFKNYNTLFTLNKSSHSSSAKTLPLERIQYPVNKGACVFISDAAVGASREAAIGLAKRGIHVLAGFPSFPYLSFILFLSSLL